MMAYVSYAFDWCQNTAARSNSGTDTLLLLKESSNRSRLSRCGVILTCWTAMALSLVVSPFGQRLPFDQQAAYAPTCILQEGNIPVDQLPCLVSTVCSSAQTDIRPAGWVCHDLESTMLISPMASIHT